MLLLFQALASCGMFGLIWLIQLAHYPLQVYVPAERFVDYQASHMRRVTFIVGPLMMIELVTSVWLVQLPLQGSMLLAAWIGIGLIVVIWLSTAALQIPCHYRLERGRNDVVINRLVLTNWIRTIAWTGRAGISLWMLAIAMPS